MIDSDVYNIVLDRENDSKAEKYGLKEELFGTTDVIPMWVADMDIVTPQCITDAVSLRAKHHIYGYEMMPQSAFEAQCEWMKHHFNWKISRDEMFYSHSVVASINIAIHAFTKEGDGIIVMPPIYPPFMGSIDNNRRKMVRCALFQDKNQNNKYCIDFEKLETLVDENTKLLLLCSPHNPVGRVWSKEELQKLANFCLEHNITIFSDEIHSDLVYAPHVHTPMATLSQKVSDITVTAIGPGKTFNCAALAISTVVVQNKALYKKYHDAYEAVHFAQGTSFGHAGFEAVYRGGYEWYQGLLKHLQSNIDDVENLVTKHHDKIFMNAAEGTYLLWLDCSGLCKKLGLNNRGLREFFIKKAKLGLSPGISFAKEGDLFMRMNIAVPKQTLTKALMQLDEALQF
jgi:cystathionine beta-lyase